MALIPALSLAGVFQHVGGHCALEAVSLTVARGELAWILGPNGAGKTLLSRLILGLDRPSAGQCRLLGLAPAVAVRTRRVGAVLQTGGLLYSLSVLDNLLLPLRGLGQSRAAQARAARLAITQLQLDGLEYRRPAALSLGQRRRVELARALIVQPEILVWDGASDGLDLPARRDILALLRLLREYRGLTVIATDHVLPEQARDAEQAVALAGGQVLFNGQVAALRIRAAQDPELRELAHRQA